MALGRREPSALLVGGYRARWVRCSWRGRAGPKARVGSDILGEATFPLAGEVVQVALFCDVGLADEALLVFLLLWRWSAALPGCGSCRRECSVASVCNIVFPFAHLLYQRNRQGFCLVSK